MITYSPDLDVLWPGALIQGNSILSIGSLKELPIKKRAPLRLSLHSLTRSNSLVVNHPSNSSVTQAISALAEPLEAAEDYGSAIAFAATETYSLEQAMLSLGLSVNYAGSGISARHSEQTSEKTNVISASFIQNCFTVTIDNPATPADFFSSDFVLPDLLEQEKLGRIGKDNAPVFLSSVTYGRMLYVTISSSEKMSKLKTSITASFTGGGGGGSADVQAENLRLLKESSIRVTATGIEEKNALDLITSGNIQKFFSNRENVRATSPISYQFRNIRSLSLAGLTDRTTYTITECRPKRVAKPSKELADHAFQLEYQFEQFNKHIGGAASNWADKDRRTQVMGWAGAADASIRNEFAWIKDTADNWSVDDMTWAIAWMPSIMDELKRQKELWANGRNANSSDEGTRNVYIQALGWADGQEAAAKRALKALAV
jgi:hypothetical protein